MLGGYMGYWFRVRFILASAGEITSEESFVTLSNSDGHFVSLQAQRGITISASTHLAILGRPYESESTARVEAASWRDALVVSLAEHRIGADFGVREPRSGHITPAGIPWIQQMFNTTDPVYNDEHGVDVFWVADDDSKPTFVRFDAQGVRPTDAGSVVSGAVAAKAADTRLSGRYLLAYDLYAASSFQPSNDARFAMLAMALEVLIEPAPRAGEIVGHVDQIIKLTNAANFPRPERDSLIGALRLLRKESITQAGIRLSTILGGQSYMDGAEDPVVFFKRTYGMRSDLMHGNEPRPSRDDISRRLGSLEMFVANLLTALGKP